MPHWSCIYFWWVDHRVEDGVQRTGLESVLKDCWSVELGNWIRIPRMKAINFICRKNEEYRKKGCESSCDKLFSKPCFDEEKFPGCYCKPGLIRDDETDECFPIEQCSERICKEPNTKLYLEWKISFCTGPGTSRTFIYNKTILPICFCKEGFASKFDVCVPISKCM